MTVRFLADENFDNAMVKGLLRRAPDTDVLTVQQSGLRTLDDPAILAWAAEEGRVVLTHDLATMKDFAFQRVEAGLAMPGVLEIPESLPRGQVIDELLLIAGASEPEDWKDCVYYLPLR
ncbi:MAG: DUF5615 family PIN-like protein [Nocardioides sp.]